MTVGHAVGNPGLMGDSKLWWAQVKGLCHIPSKFRGGDDSTHTCQEIYMTHIKGPSPGRRKNDAYHSTKYQRVPKLTAPPCLKLLIFFLWRLT
jgi:hypothetical protein